MLSSISDNQFFVESDLLDSFYEFHAEWFDGLSDNELSILDDFYGFRSRPDDLAKWRDAHMRKYPKLEARARYLLIQLLRDNGVQGIPSSGTPSGD